MPDWKDFSIVYRRTEVPKDVPAKQDPFRAKVKGISLVTHLG